MICLKHLNINLYFLLIEILYNLYTRIMKDVHIVFNDQFDTQKHLDVLMTNLKNEQKAQVAQTIGLMLYSFDVLYGNNQWTVYKSHNQIIAFIKKFNKKYKQKLTFEGIQLPDGLRPISKIHNIVQEQWFRDFCQIDENCSFKKLSLTMKKKAGGRYFRHRCCSCCAWKTCKIAIRNDGIVYMKQKDTIKEFLHFGKDFSYQLSSHFDFFQIKIDAYHRRLSLRAKNEKDYLIFIFTLKKTLQEYKKNQQQYRFNSFAPIRSNNAVKLFIDGQDYFQSVAYTIEAAKQDIFICGWWVSPQFHLVRPCQGKNLDYRFDNLLRRVAKKSVKIYIIVYFESSFLTNDSAYTKQALEGLHQNIKVIRHPNIILPTFWSHHQKLVVVDQTVAHMGGLDICYGRFDNQNHSIVNTDGYYPGIQYNNCRINDFMKVKEYRTPNVDKQTTARLPWHDIALKVQGQCVKDLSRHFIQYWNYSSYQTYYANRFVLISKPEQKKKNLLDKFKGIAKEIKDKIGHQQTGISKSMQKRNSQKQKQVNLYSKQEQKSDNSPKYLSDEPQKKNDGIKQNDIELKISHKDDDNKKTLHERILARLSPLKNQRSPKKIQTGNLQSQEDIYNKFQNKSSDQYTEQQKFQTPNKKKSRFSEEQSQKSDPKIVKSVIGIDSCYEPEGFRGTQKMGMSKSQIKGKNFFGQEYSQRQAQQYEEKYNKFKESMLKMAQIQQKIHNEENQQQVNQVQSDFIREKDPIQLKRNHYSMKVQDSEDHNPIGNWMHKIIKKVRESKQHIQGHDVSNKNNQLKQSNLEQSQFIDNCQILRSASQWSIGCKDNNTEMSIYEGYLSAIKNANKFIYIQNQFFISATKQGGVVKNRIMEAIADKIIQKIKKQQYFRVIIVMPLIPGFAGQLDDPNAAIPRVIMNWQYRTLSRNSGSLYARVSQYTKHPQQFIEVYGLRNHGVVGGIPKTQIIYIHSKLLIVDDRVLICGSANINDRSMEGNRDSEICLYLDSRPNSKKLFYNQQFMVNEKIHNLRTNLWSQHFGLPLKKLEDPLNPIIKQQMKKRAEINTYTYRELFGCYPDDNIQTLSQIKPFKKQPQLQQYEQKIQNINGNIVQFPLFFLCKQKLTSYHPNAIST